MQEPIPRIQVDYTLQGDELQYVEVFEEVANEYKASRNEDEKTSVVTVEAGEGENRTANIALGRAVLDAISTQHVYNQADLLHRHVEETVDDRIGKPGFTRIHLTGVRTFNNISASE